MEPSIVQKWQRKLRVHEYHQMIRAGVFDEDEHVELLEGVLVAMRPQGTRHAWAIQVLNRELIRQLPDEFAVRPQLPLTLAPDAEPEPDLAVVSAEETLSHESHPSSAALIIEISSDSLEKDRTVKAALYATADVAEYWIVNIAERQIEVHRDPDATGARYCSSTVIKAGETLAAERLAFQIDTVTLFR